MQANTKVSKQVATARKAAESAILRSLEGACHLFEPGPFDCGELGLLLVQYVERTVKGYQYESQRFNGYQCTWFDPEVHSLENVVREMGDDNDGEYLRFPQAEFDKLQAEASANAMRQLAVTEKAA